MLGALSNQIGCGLSQRDGSHALNEGEELRKLWQQNK